MVCVKRVGPGVTDWTITMADGTTAPPISSLSIEIAANQEAALTLNVLDVDFDGALRPEWKVSPETLAAMAADAGYAIIETDELASFEQTLNRSRAETTRQAAENTRLRRKVEEFRDAEALFKAKVERTERLVSETEYRLVASERDCAEAAAKIERLNEALAAFRRRTLELLKESTDTNRHRDEEFAALTARFTEAVSQRQDAINALARERLNLERTAQTTAIRTQYAQTKAQAGGEDATATVTATASGGVMALQEEIKALRTERSANQFIVAGARESARQRDAYEQENHTLKRRLALGGVAAAQVPALDTERYLPVIAVPTEHMRLTIQRTLGDAAKVVSYDQSLDGLRTNLVIVSAPLPEQAASARFWEQFEGGVLPRLRARLVVGGQLVRL